MFELATRHALQTISQIGAKVCFVPSFGYTDDQLKTSLASILLKLQLGYFSMGPGLR